MTRVFGIVLLGVLSLSAVALGWNDHTKNTVAPAFERLKQLEGDWAFEGDDGKTVQFTYRVSAAGTVLIETMFVGQDHEMITMYYVNGKDLMLTHYCMLGNQPTMRANLSGHSDKVSFDFVSGVNINPEKDMHMHRAIMSMPNANTLKSNWVMFEHGKKIEDKVFELTRLP